MEQKITIEPFRLNYKAFGNGNKLLIAFHGFGRSAGDFEVLAPSLEQHFTILSLDLPYHGASEQPESPERQFSKEHLKRLINALLEKYNHKRFSLLGYSLGGRISLMTWELFPELVEHIYLVAPDGIRMSLWYRFASQTKVGSSLYRGVVNNPGSIIAMAALFRSLRLIPDKMKRFVTHHMEHKDRRQLVYNVWISFKELHPKLKALAKRNGSIPKITLILGRHDVIIPLSVKNKLAKLFGKNVKIIILEKGHNLIQEELNAVFSQLLTEGK